MSELVDYFVSSYTLTIDNTESMYVASMVATREALADEHATLADYLAMSSAERAERYAYAVGANILALVEEWTDDILTDVDNDNPGKLILREVLIVTGSDVARELGKHYLPESADAHKFLDDDGDDDGDPDDQRDLARDAAAEEAGA